MWDTRARYRRVARAVDLDIEVHPMSLADYNDKYNFLASEIRKYGVKI